MHRIHLDTSTQAELEQKMDSSLEAIDSAAATLARGEVPPTVEIESKYLALVITGKAVELLLAKQKGNATTQAKFIRLAGLCAVVLACRVSPAQKALIVRAASIRMPSGRYMRTPPPQYTLKIKERSYLMIK